MERYSLCFRICKSSNKAKSIMKCSSAFRFSCFNLNISFLYLFFVKEYIFIYARERERGQFVQWLYLTNSSSNPHMWCQDPSSHDLLLLFANKSWHSLIYTCFSSDVHAFMIFITFFLFPKGQPYPVLLSLSLSKSSNHLHIYLSNIWYAHVHAYEWHEIKQIIHVACIYRTFKENKIKTFDHNTCMLDIC